MALSWRRIRFRPWRDLHAAEGVSVGPMRICCAPGTSWQLAAQIAAFVNGDVNLAEFSSAIIRRAVQEVPAKQSVEHATYTAASLGTKRRQPRPYQPRRL